MNTQRTLIVEGDVMWWVAQDRRRRRNVTTGESGKMKALPRGSEALYVFARAIGAQLIVFPKART